MTRARQSVVCRVHNRQALVSIKVTGIRQVVRHVFAAEGVAAGEVDVAVVDDAAIAEMAGRFGRPRRATDVLSFVISEPDEPPALNVAVSAETALREAARRDHPVEVELMLYVVHGLLHHMGYDDQSPAAAAKMHRREDELLLELGHGPAYGGSS